MVYSKNMEKLTFSQLQKTLESKDLSALAQLNIAILRNVTIEPIETYLRYFAYEAGFNANVSFGKYDNIFQETVAGQGEIISDELDYILIFAQLETLSSSLVCDFTSLSKDDIESEKSHIKDYVSSVLNGIRKQTNAVILWHSFELPQYPALGILDSQMTDGQSEVVIELNRITRDLLKETGNAYLVDMNQSIARLGINDFYDKRYWHIAKSPYSRLALAEIAREDFKFIHALKGKNKKCIVLDCDNTLWGGIIGEDGLTEIKLGTTYPGSVYCEFQKEVLNLYNRGVLVAICSKNNQEDVWEVFQNHPDMVLKEEHIATAQINWQDKASNLRCIAQDLNIGLDSLVFVDDSDFEINLVQQILPEVTVIHLPKEKAVDYKDMLASCGLFDTLIFSAEDKKRGAMYKAETERKKLIAEATDLESYYESLEMVATINLADDFSQPRISQLTQKTNQFNLTTRRYSKTDINEFAESQNSDVLYLKLKDRFGDMGIVGVCILVYENNTAIFDTFLLSCRALGRQVEDVFLENCLQLCQIKGVEFAVGQYFPTSKNIQVKEFFQKRNFNVMENNEAKCITHFDLSEFKLRTSVFCHEIISDFGSIAN
jgi:FkbH-like protein